MQEELFNYENTDDEDEDTQKNKYLSFYIADEQYCVEIACVVEVIGMQKITQIPDMPEFVRGVINLRGQVTPVMDVRLRFGMESPDYNDRTCIIVVNIRQSSVGIVVDSVHDVIDIPEEEMDDPPNVNQCYGNRFIKSLGKGGNDVKIVLDVDKLLFDGVGAEIRIEE